MKIPGFRKKFDVRKHPIPLVDFGGWLKSHQPTDRDEIGDLLFDHTFGHFSGGDEAPALEGIQKVVLDQAASMGFETNDTSSKANRRRFAGDWAGKQFLDRGRYSSVCMDESGEDGGTLINEFNSYLAPAKHGFSLAAYTVKNGVIDPGRIGVMLCDMDALPSSGIALAREAGMIAPDLRRVKFEMGATVNRREIDGVFDLRLPESRDWLVEFSRGDDEWLSYKGKSLKASPGFFSLLPTLMDRKVGGNDFTDQLAVYLRSHGANAMIYPSARSNVEVHFENGQLQGFAGWSLVDWSDCEVSPPRLLSWITDWAPQLEGEVTVSTPGDDSPFRGSFRVSGNEEHHLYLQHTDMLMSLASQIGDTGWVSGYRWHASRVLPEENKILAQCLECGEQFDSGNEMMMLPNQCPSCNNAAVALP